MSDTFYDRVLNYLVHRIESLDDIGIVHHYHRYTTNERGLKEILMYGAQVRGWLITREAVPAEPTGGNLYRRRHRFVIRPYYQLSDGQQSELLLQHDVDRVVELFEGDYYLGGLAKGSTPVDAARIIIVTFAGLLCHSAELSLEAVEHRIRSHRNL